MNTPRTNGRAPLAALLLLLLCAAPGATRAQGNDATTPPANRPTPTQQTPAQQQQSAAQPDGAAPAADKPERDEQPSGFIAGRVVGEGGEPLPGVVVFGVSRIILGPVGYTRRTATTEEDGSFRLTGLGPGLYNLSVNAPGYVSEVDPQTGRQPGPYKAGDAPTIRMVKGGVITGKVTDPRGEPLVGLAVRAFRVRDFEGRPNFANFAPEDKTDDRGVYRVYGLQPGVYTVVAGGRNFGGGAPFPSVFDRDVPTFYPSATRDTAAEVAVRSGQEASGIDIRHREEQGRQVTGTVEVPATIPTSEGTLSVTLNYPGGGPPAGTFFASLNSGGRAFWIEGVADGDYEAQATVVGRAGMLGASAPQRIAVRGADLTGVKLSVTPLSTISGKLVFEPAAADRARPECKDLPASPPPQEVLVSARAERAAGERAANVRRAFRSADSTPDTEGAFTLRSLEGGRYRLAALPSDERFYVSAVQLPAQAAPAPQTQTPPSGARRADATAARGAAQPAARAAQGDVVNLASGQQLTGVTIRVAAGAATLGGAVAGREGGPQPTWGPQSRVYLVPAERERAEDPLGYAEATPSADGAFVLKNLPPGRYRLLARESGAELSGPSARPLFLDAAGRAQLRREAEASGTPVELLPCQRTTDFGLRLQ